MKEGERGREVGREGERVERQRWRGKEREARGRNMPTVLPLCLLIDALQRTSCGQFISCCQFLKHVHSGVV